MLFSKQDYLNIHTHFKAKNKDEFVIRNAFMKTDNTLLSKLPYYVSCGLHPWHINTMSLNECGDKLIEIASSSKVLAIGEIGIDKAIDTPLKTQIEYFDVQLNIARAYQKPVIIHAVRSYNEFIPYLKKTKVPFIFHGFNGNEQQAKELLKYNCKLSFGKNVFEDKAQQVIKAIPDDSFLLETDSSTRINIQDVYAKAAEIKQVEMDELKSIVFHTFAGIIKPDQ